MKYEFDKLDINKLVNEPTSLNNLKTKVDDLDVSELKTATKDSEKISDVVNKDVFTNTKFNTPKTK